MKFTAMYLQPTQPSKSITRQQPVVDSSARKWRNQFATIADAIVPAHGMLVATERVEDPM
jgi:hypothetical protein